MKKIFTLILLVVSCSAYSQFSVGMHIGSSNKNVIAGLHSQYEFPNRFTVGVNMTTHLDNTNPAFFQSRFGYTLGNEEGLTIQPYLGYSYSVQNVEQKNFGGCFTSGAQFRYRLNDIAQVYADVNIPSQRCVMLSIGIAGSLPHR